MLRAYLVPFVGCLLAGEVAAETTSFRRGDGNADGKVDLSDGIHTLGFLFLGTATPSCFDAADADDSGALELTDAVFVLSFLFTGGPAPPAPGALDCGQDSSADALSCQSYEPSATDRRCPSGPNGSSVVLIRATPARGEAPLEVRFEVLDQGAIVGEDLSFEWDFGDGAQGSGPEVDHVYATAELFRAALEVKSGESLVASGAHAIYVTPVLPAQVAATSPIAGEDGVAVSRETVIEFTKPLVPESITAEAIHGAFGGRPLGARLNLSRDGKRVTLFYVEPLPASARVRVTVDGDRLLTAGLGTAADADGDGEPGGAFHFDFETLTLTALAGTSVYGWVIASELARTPGGGTIDVPLAGATVTVDGMEDRLRAVTDAEGQFVLDPAPAGSFFVHVDGRTATNAVPDGAYYPYVGKTWKSFAGRAANVGIAYLPLILPGSLHPVSETEDTEIAFHAAVLAEHPDFAGVKLMVPAGSLYADDGARGGSVGIAPVPPDRIPGHLPAGLQFPLVITVQTDGAGNFDVPVQACFPNLPDPATGEPLLPGEQSFLYSYDHDQGIWVAVGAMRVSADGRLVCTEPGVGIRAPGWHGAAPVPVTPPPPPRRVSPICRIAPQECAKYCADLRARLRLAFRLCLAGSALAGLSAGAFCAALIGETGVGLVACLAAMNAVAFSGDVLCVTMFKADSERLDAECGDAGAGAGSEPIPSLEDPALEEISRIWTEIAALIEPYSLRAEDPPSHVREVLKALLQEANSTAPGDDALHYVRDYQLRLEAEMAALTAAIGEESQGNPPPYPVHYYATVLRGESLLELRGKTLPDGQYSLFLPRDGQLLSVQFYDPRQKAHGIVFPNQRPDAPYRLPSFTLVPLDGSARDFDEDGLPDVVELVYGTLPGDPDSDSDGVRDGAEVDQGLDPLDGLVVRTGVIASADTPGFAVDVCTLGDLAVVADSEGGVSVLDVSAGKQPAVIAQVPTPNRATRVAGAGSLVAAACDGAGLVVIDISDPPAAKIRHQVAQPQLKGGALAVTAAAGTAFVGLASSDVAAVDMETGAVLDSVRLKVAGKVDEGGVHDLAFGEDLLYVLTANNLHAVAFTGGKLQLRGSGATGAPQAIHGLRFRLTIGGGFAYVVHQLGFNTFSLAVPDQPRLIAAGRGRGVEFGWKDLALNGSGLAVAAADAANPVDPSAPHDVYLYDVSDPNVTDGFVTLLETPGFAAAVAIHNGLAYVADGAAGLQVVNYLPYDRGQSSPTIELLSNFSAGRAEEGKVLRLTARVTDDVQVRSVDFYAGGAKLFTDGSFPFEHRFLTPVRSEQASITLKARALDTGGNAAWTEDIVLDLVADATPPGIVGVSPSAGALAGDVRLVTAFVDEPLDLASLTAEAFRLRGAGADGQIGTADDSSPVALRLEFRPDALAACFHLEDRLPPGLFEAELTSTARDIAGNPLSAFRWQFQAFRYVETTVTGIVQLASGMQVESAAVEELTSSTWSRTDGSGSFSFRVRIPEGESALVAAAKQIDGQSYRGASEMTAVVPGGVTPIGAITLNLQDRLQGPWGRRTPLPTLLHSFTAATLDDGIHVLGGTTSYPVSPTEDNTRAHHVYDPSTGEWSERAPLPEFPPQRVPGEGTATATSAKAAVAGGRLFVIGTNYNEEYDPAVDAWTSRTRPPIGGGYNLGFALAVFGEDIYLLGGGELSRDRHIYNVRDDAWREYSCGLCERHVVPATIGGRIYAVTAFDVQIYDPATQLWTQGARLPKFADRASGAVYGGKIYIFGGYDLFHTVLSAAVQVYDPVTDSWERLPDMPTTRSLSAAAAGELGIHLFGGINTALEVLDVHEELR